MIPSPPPNYGGLELIAYNLAQGLAELGHKTVLFATTGSKPPPKGFLVECCEPENRVHADWLQAERKMFEKYKNMLQDFDIVIGHNWFGMEYAWKATHLDAHVLHTHHGGLSMDWWGRSRPPFKLNLIAISDWMVKAYASQGFTARRCYNGIDLNLYPFSGQRGERLLWIGRVDSFKCPHVAINVARKSGLGLDIIGGTFVQDPKYLEMIRNACDGRQIRFHPDVSHETKVRLLQKCKCLLFTSKFGEPFGLCPIEAFACGKPVISTIDGATPETVKDGEVGFLCNTEDEMVAMLKEVDKIEPKHCREWVEGSFTVQTMAKAYETRFHEVLNGDEW